jgi:hypothetical protein
VNAVRQQTDVPKCSRTQFGLRTLFALVALCAIVSYASRIDPDAALVAGMSFFFTGPDPLPGYFALVLGVSGLIVMPVSIPVVFTACLFARPMSLFLWSYPIGVAMIFTALYLRLEPLLSSGMACLTVGGIFSVVECGFKDLPKTSMIGAGVATAAGVTGFLWLVCVCAMGAAC